MPLMHRLILGLTNGITPALRTTLREVCGKEHVLRGMTYLSGEGLKAGRLDVMMAEESLVCNTTVVPHPFVTTRLATESLTRIGGLGLDRLDVSLCHGLPVETHTKRVFLGNTFLADGIP